MKHKRRVTESVMEEAQQRNDEIKEQLKSNENYRQISHLEDRLSDLIEETKESTTTLDQLQKVMCMLNISVLNLNCYLFSLYSIDILFVFIGAEFHLHFQEYNHDDVINDAKDKLKQITEFLRANTPTTMTTI